MPSRYPWSRRVVRSLPAAPRLRSANSPDAARYLRGWAPPPDDPPYAGFAMLTKQDLKELAANAFNIAWLSTKARDAFLAELDAYCAPHSPLAGLSARGRVMSWACGL